MHSHSPALERGRSNPASHEPQSTAHSSQPINIATSFNDLAQSRSFAFGSLPVGSISSSIGEDVEEEDEFDEVDRSSVAPETNGNASGKKGRALKVKKRGTIFQCESCSKVSSTTCILSFI